MADKWRRISVCKQGIKSESKWEDSPWFTKGDRSQG